MAQVEGEKCAACLSCVRVCPYHVPQINEKGEAEIDISKCARCHACVEVCNFDAIRGFPLTARPASMDAPEMLLGLER